MPPQIRPLSESLARKAALELNENPDRIQADLDAIREWLKKTPHLRCRQDDQFLVAFLRGCKYSLEKVKEKLDMYYTVRSALPEITSNRDPLDPKIQEIIRLGFYIPLPNTDSADGPIIGLFRPGVFDPKKFSMVEMIKVAMMINEILIMNNDNFTVAGQAAVIDVADFTMSHFVSASSVLPKLMAQMQYGAPGREKGFFIINMASPIEALFSFIKSFLNEKMRSRFYVFGEDRDSLYKHVPQKLLPVELGGKNGLIEEHIQKWNEILVANRGFFKDQEQYGVDETKRQLKHKQLQQQDVGTQGSFRALSID